MLKRLILSLVLAFGTILPANAFGTIPISLTQRFDNSSHLPLAGGLIYFYQAGTPATPQNAFQDPALTIPYANPLTLDAGGNIPQLFFADGLIKIRITNSAGVSQLTQDNIQVIGASSGTSSGGSVDPTTIAATGDLKAAYGTAILSGWVRLNGRTIGSATSGATERANADCQALFQYLWGVDPNLAVSGGRGATAAADWAANKTITLPDGRNSVIAGLGDMGSTDRALFAGVTFGTGNSTTLGSFLGAGTRTIGQAQLPNVTLSYSGNVTVTSSANNVVQGGVLSINNGSNAPITALANGAGSSAISSTGSYSGNTASLNGNVTQTGLPTVQPTLLATIYIKL